MKSEDMGKVVGTEVSFGDITAEVVGVHKSNGNKTLYRIRWFDGDRYLSAVVGREYVKFGA